MMMALVAAAAVGFSLITMLVAHALVHGALEREIRAVRAGQYAREIGYRRYMASSVTIVRYAVTIALLVPLVSVVALLSLTSDSVLVPLARDAGMERVIGIIFGYGLCLVGALFTIPLAAYDLLTVRLGVRALAELRGIDLGGREALAYRLKQVLVRIVPSFVFLEAVGVAALINIVTGLVVFVAGLMVLVYVRRALAVRLILWMTPGMAIERTPWAALGPRIRAWGRLMGVQVQAIYVPRTERLGVAPIAAVGPRRARVLFLGDALLRTTDWRQQDALVVHALGPNAATIARRRRRFPTVVSLGILALALGLVGAATLTAQRDAEPPLVVVIALLMVALLVLLGFVAALGVSLFSLIVGRQRARKPFLEADARAVVVTGDPLGLLVALNTLHALTGIPTDRRIGIYPSIAERVAALDALLRQPGPRAPYAWQLVPSTVPVYVGPHCLTIPLAVAPQTVPAPVPAGPYPVVMPPAPAPIPGQMPPVPAMVPAPTAAPPAPPAQPS